jgi:murein L,D-transpeptidase YcbB/YkuD
MLRNRFLVTLLLASLASASSGVVMAQTTAKAPTPALELDPGTSADAPDPLTPAETKGPPPAAPGAPAELARAAPGESIDPIVEAARKIIAAPTGRLAEHKDDAAALVEFYGSIAKPAFVDAGGVTARGRLVAEEIAKADDWGLKASAFDVPKPVAADATAEDKAKAELKFAAAALTYARHARGGRFDPTAISRLFDQKPTIYDPKSLIAAVAASETADAYLRDLHPKHAGFHNLRKALLAARAPRREEPAPPAVQIPSGPSIKPGQEHAHVALVRTRLGIEAGSEGREAVYDDTLTGAVKAFQRLRSLEPTGIINAATRNAMNDAGKPTAATDNIRRIVINMERWRWLPADLGEFHVWDSVPEQMTTVFENDKAVLSERIVVGKINTPTVMFSADMQFVIFHPSWGVPPGMKSQELGPQLRNTGGGGWFSSAPLASQVLAAHGLKVSRGGVPVDPDSVNWASANVTSFDFTQPPGPKNVLGIVKFRFPNRHDIYMHDTPERHLFGGAVRAFSHGCMRVQNPVKLAEVVLAYDKGYDHAKVAEFVRRGGEIKLTKRVPVHITYFTAVADDEGQVKYFADIYGLDGRVASAIEGQQVRVAGVAPPTGSTPTSEERSERPKKERASRKKAAKADEGFNPFASIFGN